MTTTKNKGSVTNFNLMINFIATEYELDADELAEKLQEMEFTPANFKKTKKKGGAKSHCHATTKTTGAPCQNPCKDGTIFCASHSSHNNNPWTVGKNGEAIPPQIVKTTKALTQCEGINKSNGNRCSLNAPAGQKLCTKHTNQLNKPKDQPEEKPAKAKKPKAAPKKAAPKKGLFEEDSDEEEEEEE